MYITNTLWVHYKYSNKYFIRHGVRGNIISRAISAIGCYDVISTRCIRLMNHCDVLFEYLDHGVISLYPMDYPGKSVCCTWAISIPRCDFYYMDYPDELMYCWYGNVFADKVHLWNDLNDILCKCKLNIRFLIVDHNNKFGGDKDSWSQMYSQPLSYTGNIGSYQQSNAHIYFGKFVRDLQTRRGIHTQYQSVQLQHNSSFTLMIN